MLIRPGMFVVYCIMHNMCCSLQLQLGCISQLDTDGVNNVVTQ